MSDKPITPMFHSEVQLAGWSESHNGGCKVTFWLAQPSDLDAFRAMTVRKGNTAGQRLACALVEIGDDEQPVQAPAAMQQKGGALAQLPQPRLALALQERVVCGGRGELLGHHDRRAG